MKTYYSVQTTLGEPELLIRGISADDTGEYSCLWVELIYFSDTRRACYELTPEGWQYLTGDNEPDMPDDLRRAWHGREGDKALDWCLSREITA